MKKSTLIVTVVALLLSLSGCDWVRGQLGMPVSSDLELARKLRDSSVKVVVAEKDTVKDSLKDTAKIKEAVVAPENDTLAKVNLPVESVRYHIVAGSFKDHDNARKLGDRLRSAGIEPIFIDFETGFRMVSAGGYETLEQARRKMNDLLATEMLPDGLWIYDSKKR